MISGLMVLDILKHRQGKVDVKFVKKKNHSLHLSQMQRVTSFWQEYSVFWEVSNTPLMFLFLKDTKLLAVLKSRGLDLCFQYILNCTVFYFSAFIQHLYLLGYAMCITASGNILASGNLCFRVFKLQLKFCYFCSVHFH